MRIIENVFAGVVVALIVALPVQAQTDELPDFAYEAFTEISLATTAGNECDGATVRDRNVQVAATGLMEKLVATGLDPVAAIQHLETEAGKEKLAERVLALRAKHGVAAEGNEALCEAIRAEAKESKTLAKLVRMR